MDPVSQQAKSIGLTRKQFQYYSRWFVGMTHREIAIMFKTARPRVSEVIARALRRNPNLPRPITCRQAIHSQIAVAA